MSGLALPGWIYSIYSSFNLVGKNGLIKTAQASKWLVRISRPVPRECATQNYFLASLTPLLISTRKYVAYDLFLDDNFMYQSPATTSPNKVSINIILLFWQSEKSEILMGKHWLATFLRGPFQDRLKLLRLSANTLG